MFTETIENGRVVRTYPSGAVVSFRQEDEPENVLPDQHPPNPLLEQQKRMEILEEQNTMLGQMVTQQEIESMVQGQQLTDMELRILMMGAN